MFTVQSILDVLEKIAPERLAFSYDNVGLQVGDPNSRVTKIVVSLDRSNDAIDFAIENKADLLITHHPLFFKNPIKNIQTNSPEGKVAIRLIQNNIAHIAAHTNWDCAIDGLNDYLAEIFELKSVSSFGLGEPLAEVLVSINVPTEPSSYAQAMIDVLTKVGAGIHGKYDRCAFYTDGTGTYLPLEGANMLIGQVNQISDIPETQIQMSFEKKLLPKVYSALIENHPYDEPSFEFYNLEPLQKYPAGRFGKLPHSYNLEELIKLTEHKLNTKVLAWGNPKTKIDTLAVIGGSADFEWKAAQAKGAQALITGEVKQKIALEASEAGFILIAAGHYATEHLGCVKLIKRLKEHLPTIEYALFEPTPGLGGRPLVIA